ncbi:MAG: 50S ribosomal protein L20 [Candidatus Tectomicrobia bacterium]|nr:50S ribosomal protein L20 [Candidatus Tectomicrobia bacterium]
MPRATSGPATRHRRKKVLKLAKGYRGARSRLYKTARETVDRALKYAYSDRKKKKRDFRSLWIIRINAAARLHGLSYSTLIHGLKEAQVNLNRKILADMAVHDPEGFQKIADLAKSHARAMTS